MQFYITNIVCNESNESVLLEKDSMSWKYLWGEMLH